MSAGRRLSNMPPTTGANPHNFQNLRTPPELFAHLDAEFGFTLDAAASDTNHLCPRYYTMETDGLVQSWAGERVFVNPPWSSAGKWAAKAASSGAEVVVLLHKASTDTRWWTEGVAEVAHEIRFVAGRPDYVALDGRRYAVPAASTIAIFLPLAPPPVTPKVTWGWTYPGRLRQGWFDGRPT